MTGKRYVEPLSLGAPRETRQDRLSPDGTMGIWRKPGWKPDRRAFRCGGCKAVVPWSCWSKGQQRAFCLGGGMPARCTGCGG